MWFKLTGDSRLGRCATEGCGGQPTERLEADGVGSSYCSGCRERIERPRIDALHDTRNPNELRRQRGW